jgi:DNA-binding NtrC family response regulator
MPVVSDFGFTMRPSRRDLVLVVADDGAVGAALIERLQEDGYSVLSAARPDEAMAMLPTTHANALVLATESLAEVRLEKPIPVIFVGYRDNAPALATQINASRFASAASPEQISEAVAAALASPKG